MAGLTLGCLFGVGATLAQTPQSAASRQKALKRLFDEQWEYSLSHSPETASGLGDRRWNDKVSDVSMAAIAEDQRHTRQFLARLSAVDPAGLPEQDALTRTLLIRRLEENLENGRLAVWEMPVTPYSGIHLQALELPEILPFQAVKDYEDYVARLKQLSKQLDDTVAAMRKGMADQLMPPRHLLDRIAVQAEGVARLAPEKTRFAEPLERMPPIISPSERSHISGAFRSAIADSVQPAYRRFAKFVREEYAPKGRPEPGLWSLPDGAARYTAAVRRATTTRWTPEELHQLGLAQVEELERQVAVIARKAGLADAKSLADAIDKNPKLRPRSPEDVLDRYRKFTVGMAGALTALFSKRPRAGLTVVASDPQSLSGALPPAQYRPGSSDDSKLARLVVNPGSPTHRTTIFIETTAYHEGVPGHHIQVGLAQEMRGLPKIRRQSAFAAFSEGWAIYAERLAKDIGFFTDPYSDYGRVHEELLRSSRLVADTGLHAKKWPRQTAVAYLRDHGNLPDADAQSEVDRMIYRPAESLAAEAGALKILQLRERARHELAGLFRLPRFHHTVLDAGSIPLDMLEERIDSWIAAEKKAGKVK